MKTTSILMFASLSLFSTCTLAATASEIQVAKACLAYGKQIMKDNPGVLNTLKQVKVDGKNEDIQLNKYNGNIGKQYISTELVAKIHSNQENLGTILCLFESDKKPLYFHYAPFK